MAWFVHLLVAKAVLRSMALPASVPWVELAAYTGYSFVPVCLSILAGQLGGHWAYWGAWAYGSMCMAVFLVRTMKRVIFQETRGYGTYRAGRGGVGRKLRQAAHVFIGVSYVEKVELHILSG